MALKRHAGSGFTLTEVLMAVGILGVGMVMVGTIFPVAINQSRRSEESTRAALCARSVAATLRARRGLIVPYLHTKTTATIVSYSGSVYLGTAIFPDAVNVYNPEEFMYRTSSTRTYDNLTAWRAGNYTTKMTGLSVNYPKNASDKKGPWKICIFVYRARGAEVAHGLWNSQTLAPQRPVPGDYVFDRLGTGDAYMIGRVDDNKTKPASPTDVGPMADDKIYVATGKLAVGSPPLDYFTANGPICFPGSVMAYHTILGD